MPVGHQMNVLVYGPGGYRFGDYTRVGLWLNMLLLTVITLLLPLIWPLESSAGQHSHLDRATIDL
jgi:di/tricarboxylate transporter